MLAGEAAKVLGVGIQTLHFYEQQGLIPPPPRSEGGYRIYTPEIVERVRFIRKAQVLGFSLDDVKEIFGLVRKGSSPCGQVQAKLAEKLEEVDRRLEELRGFRAELASLVAQAAELSAHEAGVCSIVEEAKPLPVSSLVKRPLSRKRGVPARRREPARKK
jgi:DNA-binding transcriptional MerR regulator